ncbi:MAG: alpha/beta hydrolase [Marinomonas gallaica]
MIDSWQHLHSKPDILGNPFVAHTYHFDGSVSAVVTTVIEYVTPAPSHKAILYLHGYTDYFFQDQLAHHFEQLGLRFFALDLQGYGRSIRPNSVPNWCESLSQYHDDIHIALTEMYKLGVTEVTLLAHSTGGLIASSYVSTQQASEQDTNNKPHITGLMLNSPFLALPFSPNIIKHVSWPIWLAVSLLPYHSLRAHKISLYAQTLHQEFGGEWSYRLDWKPAHGFPLSFHWLKQVILAQRALQKYPIALPTLMCHSKSTTRHALDIEEVKLGDGVLDVDSMNLAANNAFSQLTAVTIEGGYHDLFLSPKPIRQRYLTAIDQWLLDHNVISSLPKTANG